MAEENKKENINSDPIRDYLSVQRPGEVSVIETVQVLTGDISFDSIEIGAAPNSVNAGAVIDYRIRDWIQRGEDIIRQLEPIQNDLNRLQSPADKSSPSLDAILEANKKIQVLINARRALVAEIEAGGYRAIVDSAPIRISSAVSTIIEFNQIEVLSPALLDNPKFWIKITETMSQSINTYSQTEKERDVFFNTLNEVIESTKKKETEITAAQQNASAKAIEIQTKISDKNTAITELRLQQQSILSQWNGIDRNSSKFEGLAVGGYKIVIKLIPTPPLAKPAYGLRLTAYSGRKVSY